MHAHLSLSCLLPVGYKNRYFDTLLTLCVLVNFSRFFCRLLFYFQKNNFSVKFFQEYHLSVKQFGSRSGPTLSGLNWVQTVCKGYQVFLSSAGFFFFFKINFSVKFFQECHLSVKQFGFSEQTKTV